MKVDNKWINMVCGHEECGIEYRVRRYFYRACRDSGRGIFCPNGHKAAFRITEVARG